MPTTAAASTSARRRRHVPLLPLLLLLLQQLLGAARAGAPPGPETAYNDAGYLTVAEGRRHVRAFVIDDGWIDVAAGNVMGQG